MPLTFEIKPEKIVLEDGREGYFINAPVRTGAVIVVKYPALGKKLASVKTARTKKSKQSRVARSVVTALKEVKSRKSKSNYPKKDFDVLIDEL